MMRPHPDVAPVCHLIQASPADVFAAWITPDDIAAWWGPTGFTTQVLRLDAVAGGAFVFRMTAPDGTWCDMTGRYQRVEPPSLLVFDVFDHCNLNLPDGVEPQLDPSRVTVLLTAKGSATEVAVTHTSLGQSYSGLAAVSWGMTLHKLAARIAMRHDF